MDNPTMTLEKFNNLNDEKKYKCLIAHSFINISPEVIDYICENSEVLNSLYNQIQDFHDYNDMPKQIQNAMLKKYKNNIISLFLNQKDNHFLVQQYNSLTPELQKEIASTNKDKLLKLFVDYITKDFLGVQSFMNLPIEIQNDLLNKYRDEFFKYFFNQHLKSNFSQCDLKLQEKLLSFYEDDIINVNSKSKLEILININSQELQDNLLKNETFFKEIVLQLTLEQNGMLLEYLINIKNFETFKKLYNNPHIFKKLMLENKNTIVVFNYSCFAKASIEIQEYILNDLKDKLDYQIQFNELLKYASLEVKKNFYKNVPDEINSLCQYITLFPDNLEAKEKLLTKIEKKNVMFNDISTILNLYPNYIDEKFLEKLFESTPLIYLSINFIDIFNKNENIKTIFIDKVKARIKQNATEITDIDSKIVGLLNYSDEELFNILDNISPSEILNNCKAKYIQKYIISKLNQNPNYLKDVSLEEFFLHHYNKEFLISIEEYISPEIIIRISDELNDKVIKILTDNPALAQLVNSTSLLQALYNKFGINEITENIPFDLFLELKEINNSEIINYCLSKITTIDIVNNYNFTKFYQNLDDNQKQSLIANTTYLPNFTKYYSLEKNEEIRNTISKKILQNQDDIFDYSRLFLIAQNLDDDIIYKLNDKNLCSFYLFNKNVNIEKEIINRFETNHYLFNNNEQAEEIFENLLLEDKEKIRKILKSNLIQAFGSNPELYKKLINNDTILNFKVVEEYEKGFFKNDNNLKTFQLLIDANPYVVSTLNFEFLKLNFNIKDNGRFLKKITKYPEIEKRILNIKETNEDNFKLLNNLITTFNFDDNKIFDRKLMIVLNNLEKNNYSFNHELNEKEINNLMRYILLNSKVFQFSKKTMNIQDIDMLNYSEEIAKRCDKDYQNAQSLLDKKNILFMKFFDITYEDALEFIRMYDNDLDGVKVNGVALSYMECIKEIINFKKEEEFDAFYNGYSPRYSINDLFVIENDYQKAYTESLLNSMYQGNGDKQYIEIEGKQIEVILPNENFKMLVHSTNAYSKLPMIDNNFYKSWNLSKKTNNHGICTALVSDKSLGFPPLNDGGGCIFGFTEFSINSITNMAPYDICSDNSDYELITNRPLIYSNPDSILDMTRHSHNEFVIERTNLLNNNTINIQPNYVIITNEMDDERKKNALKASREMNPPAGLPIIYIDFETLINKNKKNILYEMSSFIKTGNTKLLANLLNTYESVMCTCFNINKYDFITPEEINHIIYKYINECININDIASLDSIIDVLNTEKSKFDLIKDFEHRSKNMHIDYNGIVSTINEYKKTIEESMVTSRGKQR